MSSAFDEPAKMNLLNGLFTQSPATSSRSSQNWSSLRKMENWKISNGSACIDCRLSIRVAPSNAFTFHRTRTDELENASIVSTESTNPIPNVFEWPKLSECLLIYRFLLWFQDSTVSAVMGRHFSLSLQCGFCPSKYLIKPFRTGELFHSPAISKQPGSLCLYFIFEFIFISFASTRVNSLSLRLQFAASTNNNAYEMQKNSLDSVRKEGKWFSWNDVQLTARGWQ